MRGVGSFVMGKVSSLGELGKATVSIEARTDNFMKDIKAAEKRTHTIHKKMSP